MGDSGIRGEDINTAGCFFHSHDEIEIAGSGIVTALQNMAEVFRKIIQLHEQSKARNMCIKRPPVAMCSKQSKKYKNLHAW